MVSGYRGPFECLFSTEDDLNVVGGRCSDYWTSDIYIHI